MKNFLANPILFGLGLSTEKLIFFNSFFFSSHRIVGLVAATQLQQKTEKTGAWNLNKEYRYNLWTRTVTAIPELKNQWVGVIGTGKLTIRPQSNDVLVGKLENVKYAQVHHELSGGWDEFIPKEQLEFVPAQMNEKPFEVRLRNGVIHSIAVDKTMTNNDINQLKAALSQLQVDIRGQNLIKSKYNQLPEDGINSQAVYKVMEPTVTGKCETLYDISPLPEYLIQTHREWAPLPHLKGNGMHFKIVKTKNYDHCEHRLGYHFGLSGANEWKVNTNTMGEAVSKSAISDVIVSGKLDEYTIQSSVTVNKVIAKPGQNDQKHAEVVGAVNLTLESVQETHERPQVLPKQLIDVGNLVYTYDLPSDPTNKVRPMGDSSEEYVDDTENENVLLRKRNRKNQSSSEAGDIDEVDALKNDNIYPRESTTGHRRPRSVLENTDEEAMEDKEIDDAAVFGVKKQLKRLEAKYRLPKYWSENHEEFYQPKPTLKYAPELPLLPMFIGYRGQSIQNVKQIDVYEITRKLAQEIANDMQNANEIPLKNTLTKFNILSEVIRTMEMKQIEKLADEFYFDESEAKTTDDNVSEGWNSNEHKYTDDRVYVRSVTWKVFRDAVTEAGTGPAITLSMRWIQQRKIRGEDAAQLIAAWPKTIREPTEDMQRAFYVSLRNQSEKRALAAQRI